MDMSDVPNPTPNNSQTRNAWDNIGLQNIKKEESPYLLSKLKKWYFVEISRKRFCVWAGILW